MGIPLPVPQGGLCRTKTPRRERGNRMTEDIIAITSLSSDDVEEDPASSHKRCPPSVISRASNPGRAT